jgi:FkbM family methyltransferase
VPDFAWSAIEASIEDCRLTAKMKNLEKIVRRLFLPGSQSGYAQFGEDLIVNYLFHDLGIQWPTYLDIGANHPRFISNTYYFYQRGSHGVLVEPNPRLSKKLRSVRPRDIVLEIGIGSASTEADLYIFGGIFDGLSTFSKTEATHWETVGLKGHGPVAVDTVVRVPVIPVNEVIASHFRGRAPNFLSLDIEGNDLEVLMSLDFEHFAPDVICVESLSYDKSQNGFKRTDIIEFIRTKDYEIYADTRVNTIFVRRALLGSS